MTADFSVDAYSSSSSSSSSGLDDVSFHANSAAGIAFVIPNFSQSSSSFIANFSQSNYSVVADVLKILV